jgi:HK97 family phage portal protein
VVNESTAMSVLVVRACVELRARALSSLPCRVMERVDENTKQPAKDHRLTQLLRKPNSFQTRSELFGMLEGHKALRGNGFAWKNVVLFNRKPLLTELIPMHPDRVELVNEPDNFGGPTKYRYHQASKPPIDMASHEVFHLKAFSTNGRSGRSVLTDMRESIGGAIAAQEYSNTLWSEDGVPRVALKYPEFLDDEPAEKLEKRWQETYGRGADKRRVAVLEGGLDIKELSLKPIDVQFLESRKFTRSELAAAFHVPPHMVGDTEKSTSWGSGIEQQQIGFVTFTMQSDIVGWEERMNLDLVLDEPERFFFKFFLQGFMRGDSAARADFYERMWRMGVFTINQILILEDLNPIGPDGDLRFVPLNYIPLGTDIDEQARANALVADLLGQLRKERRPPKEAV